MDTDADFDEVETLLESDLEEFDGELGQLYDNIERYAQVADAMDSAGRGDDAEYFKELAVDSYQSFAYVIQMKKEPTKGRQY